MRKILIFTHEYPPYPGGIARYAGELARAAAEAGHEVHVVAPGYGDKDHPQEARPGAVTVHRTRAGEYRGSRLPAMIWEVLHHTRKQEWDFVHAADRPYATVLAFVARFKRLDYQATAHGTDVMTLHRSKATKLLCHGNPYAASNRILCNSDFTRDLLHRELPDLPRDKSLVTHLGVNAFWFGEPGADLVRALRLRLGIKAEQRIVLTVARRERRKGHLAVLRSLAGCWQAGIQDLHYVIVGPAGEAEYEAELGNEVGRMPFPVTLTGVLAEPELRALYRAAAVFCMPGLPVAERIEGFGLAYLEAAACSLPSIGTRMGGVSEVIKDRETGFLLPEPDTTLLNTALRSLLTDELLRQRMGAAAQRWARDFTWERCALLTFGGTATSPAVSATSDRDTSVGLIGFG
jgi:glycosyltransferase involved in cell wall biosynthesis